MDDDGGGFWRLFNETLAADAGIDPASPEWAERTTPSEPPPEPVDLLGEWYDAVRLAGQLEDHMRGRGEWLDAWGIDMGAARSAGGVGLTWVRSAGPGLYEPHPEPYTLTDEQRAGAQAFLTLCLDGTDVTTLCAWTPRSPHRWRLRAGCECAGAILGDSALDFADWRDMPVLVQPNPTTWFRADCRGVVLLDHGDPFARVWNADLITFDRSAFKRLREARRKHKVGGRIELRQ